MEHTSSNPHLTLTLVRTPRDAADAQTAREIETIDLLDSLDDDQRLANTACVFCGELAETPDYGPMLLCDGIRKGKPCDQPWHSLCMGLGLRVPDGPFIGPCCRTAESDAETEPSAPSEPPRAAPSSRKRKRGQPPPPPLPLASERLPPPSALANIEWPPRGYAQVEELESGDDEAAADAPAAEDAVPEWQRAADDANGTECNWPDDEEAVEEAAEAEPESADIAPPPAAPLAPPPPPPAALPAAPPPLPIAPAVSPVPPLVPEAAERSVEARFALLERLWDREFLSIEEYKVKREELLRLV